MTEYELDTAIVGLKSEYHNLSTKDGAQAEKLELSLEIKSLTEQRNNLLSNGAKACECGGLVIGMKIKQGVYEVGCLNCVRRSRGESPSEAVVRWNADDYFTPIV